MAQAGMPDISPAVCCKFTEGDGLQQGLNPQHPAHLPSGEENLGSQNSALLHIQGSWVLGLPLKVHSRRVEKKSKILS